LSQTSGLVEHFFRHEYGRVVAVLVRRFGAQHIETIEDAVQLALSKALSSWMAGGLPDNPSAWLFSVARNQLLSEFRQKAGRGRLLAAFPHEFDVPEAERPDILMANEVQDDLLRMLFACCDDAIATEAQLVLALKVLCGFDIGEIAARLFITEATAYKRLTRARGRLKQAGFSSASVAANDYEARLPAVHAIIYLIFTEGYLSSHAERAIRKELCAEAIRLASLLVAHPAGQQPETFALLALMHLHAARMIAREDAAGGLLLLEEQDRALWDQHQIGIGLDWLAKAAQGSHFSRYHAEAGVAAEHCLAPSFAETRWERVAECYGLLEQMAPSALHRLNRAVAVAEWRGPAEGLGVLKGFEPPAWLVGSYMWAAVLADLHARCRHVDQATHYRAQALELAPSDAVRATLARRLGG